ncbi:MAG: toxic anion resistance protein, partial [Burkholderiaceae bacterium]
ADMKVLQHAALQQLPMIRMVQTNNRMLIEKFHTIRELTVPAWKRQFMLALSLNEQKSAVQLANSIDDATNRFLLENAKLLKDNTLSTARANQRLVIDVETLRQVHDSLVETMQEVIRINADGVKARAQVSNDLRQMREALAAGNTLPARAEKAGDGQTVRALAGPGRKTR